jgi:hypothetical protein
VKIPSTPGREGVQVWKAASRRWRLMFMFRLETSIRAGGAPCQAVMGKCLA